MPKGRAVRSGVGLRSTIHVGTERIIGGDPVNIKGTVEFGATDLLGVEEGFKGMEGIDMSSRALKGRGKVHMDRIRVGRVGREMT
jgi:hypothetical protein